MIWLLLGLAVVLSSLSLLAFRGAPYLPTQRQQINLALELLDLAPGQLLIELGAGTGGLTLAAAKKGIKVKAYELNPLLVIILKIRTYRYRKLVEVKMADIWQVDLPPADGVYVFLLDKFMPRLDKKLSQSLPKGSKLVSYAFEVPGKKPVKAKGAMFLYQY